MYAPKSPIEARRLRMACGAALIVSAFCASALSNTAQPVRAQDEDGQRVVVHRVFPKEDQRDATGSAALELKVVYSIINRDDQSALDAEKVLGAKISFEKQKDIVPTTDEPIESASWNIVLLTDFTDAGNQDDGSGLNAARVGLSRELEQGPEGLYAWYDINEASRPRQEDFKPLKDEEKNSGAGGEDKDTSIPALLSTPVRAPSQTLCLYRGVLNAIKKVQTAPGRKAVLVLTHQPDNCPTPTPISEVLEAATNTRNEGQLVQIFAIGLGNEALRRDLENLTLKTGGAAFVTTSQDTLRPTIRQLMSLMKGQREASFIVYPKKGEHNARLDASLSETTIKSAAFKFSNELDYALPPSIDVINTPSSPEGINVILRAVSPERLKNLKLQLIDQASARPIRVQAAPDTATFFDKDGNARWLIPRKEGESELQPGVTYQLLIGYELPNGNPASPFADTGSTTVEYDPVPPRIGISARGPTVKVPSFVITVTSNADATAIDIFLARPEALDKPLSDVRQLIVNSGSARSVEIPAEGLPEGEYVARAEWSGVSETGANSPPMGFYQETALQRLVREAQENPTVRYGLIGVAVMSVLSILGLFLLFKARSVSQVKVLRGEGRDDNRVRKIQIDLPPSGRSQEPRAVPVERPAESAKPAADRPAKAAEPVAAKPATPELPGARIRAKSSSKINFRGKIRKSPFSVGRDANGNDGVLPVDASSGVSRKHATFVFMNKQWHVQDENTPNGTKVNGAKLSPGVPTPLVDGAIVTLGTIELEFTLGDG